MRRMRGLVLAISSGVLITGCGGDAGSDAIEMTQKFHGAPRPNETVYTLTRAQAPAQVTAYDFASRAPKASIDLSLTGDYTQVDQMFASVDGKRLHVLLERSPTSIDLATIDTATNTVLHVTPIGPLLTTFTGYSLQPAPDGKQVYLSSKNVISVIDTDSGALVRKLVLPAAYSLIKVVTAKNDDEHLYALANQPGNQLEVLRIETASAYIVGGYPAGSASSKMNREFAVTDDAKKAYFVSFTSFDAEGNLTEMDLESGITRVLTDLPEKNPSFLTTIGNGQILFADDNDTSPSTIILYDVANRTRTTLLTSSSLVEYMQYDPTTESVLFERSDIASVSQLKQRANGKYRSIDLGMRSFTSGSVPGGVTPFVALAR
ncbi:hypothetical protein NOV72_01610 [Caballeronia novacaledonica]|uniref:Lipoprotein n=1 Tax=Caballeronia novacaledonica TaxID=1544861 RepID=A0A2U3I2N6_9BURK|nr:hypothetical protein [Caballeronia novacaledonica]SPB14368.1 hypothetical protein NOV72_01610 [Caballeronia novacaledonica]